MFILIIKRLTRLKDIRYIFYTEKILMKKPTNTYEYS